MRRSWRVRTSPPACRRRPTTRPALVAALAAAADVESALKRYEAARLTENFRIIERARHLGAYLQATQTHEERARAGLHATDGAVIAETAVLDFLYG